MEERVQKLLARAGLGSRRACEEIISMGRVTVNGEQAILGTKADPGKDSIKVDGSVLQYQEPEKVYIMLNKPRFVLSDHDPADPRQSVYAIVPDSEHLFVVGRLDFESEGLILLTNDGDLANKLSHPRYGKEKEYQVLVAKRPDDKQLKAWRHGVVLEDGDKTGPAEVVISGVSGKGAWLRVIMTEGRKRQIREIGKTIGLPIVRLIRTRIGTLELGDLKSSEYKPLSEKQVRDLRVLVSGKAAVKKQEQTAEASSNEGNGERKPWEKARRSYHSDSRSNGNRLYGKRSGDSSYAKRDGDKPYAKRSGDSSYTKHDGDRPYAKRDTSSSYAKHDGDKPYAKRSGDSSYVKRDGDRPYAKRSGDSSYAKRDGDKPYAKRSGDSSYVKHDGDRPYAKRDTSSSYAKRDGDKPYAKRSGDSSYTKHDGDRPYVKRDGNSSYDKHDGDKPYVKRDGSSSYGKHDGDKPYVKRSGDSSYGKHDNNKPYSKRGNDKPYDRNGSGKPYERKGSARGNQRPPAKKKVM